MADLMSRAATVRIRGSIRKAGHDSRAALEFKQALDRETRLSLQRRDRWPYTGGERWRGPSTAALKQQEREAG